MRKLIFFLILMALFTISCFKQINKVVVVLVDLSESTNRPEMRKLYSDSFEKVLNKLTHGDAFFVAPITEKSLVELNFIVEEERLAPIDVGFNVNIREEKEIKRKASEELIKKKRDIRKIVDNVLSRPGRRILRTDILSSLNMVDERVFRSYKEYVKKLVIMSDMIEDSDSYNFEKENLTPKRIKQIINLRKNKRLIPDLKGVKIYIVGAFHPKVKKYLQIKDFWMEYLKESGAILSKENYSSTCPVHLLE